MKTLLATVGSHGDLRPFYALARELERRGHDVLLAGPDHYEAEAAARGVPFRKIGPPWNAAEMEQTFARVLSMPNPLKQLSAILDVVTQPEIGSVAELLEMASAADVVVYPPLLIAAAAAARARGVPHVSVQLAPVHRSRHYGPTGTDLGPLLNGLAWRLGSWVLRRETDAKLNTIVAAAGLPPWKDVLLRAASSSWLDLIAVSPQVLAHDPGWPAASHLTGYWFLDQEETAIDPALEAFVGDDRPVVVGFGSMHGFDAAAMTRLIFEAAEGLERKVVVQAGWAGLGGVRVPDRVHVTSFVPHTWLFARASAVVHHGGAGTTAAAFRAGVPQAIVWHLGDQPTWGKRVELLGAGPPAISHRKVTAAWLRAQIDRMTTDVAMQEKARDLGERIRAENGVGRSVDLLEARWSERAPPSAAAAT